MIVTTAAIKVPAAVVYPPGDEPVLVLRSDLLGGDVVAFLDQLLRRL